MAPANERTRTRTDGLLQPKVREFRAIRDGRQPMFNNLIESSSHRKEFKRRGSFFLFTVGTYLLLFVITGVASIYAYDANLGQQSYEITWLPPVNLQDPQTTEPPRDTTSVRPSHDSNESNIAQREIAMARVDDPQSVPPNVSTTPNKNLPLPTSGLWKVGPDRDPISGGSPGPAIDGSRMVRPTGPIQVDAGEPPPSPAATPANRILKVSKILNSQALSLPRPTYPIIARQMRLQGVVNVQVLIDEEGRVVSAKALTGPGVLIPAAQQAAMQARFSPTIVGDQPVKVSGVITYNFVMQ
jgi:protein TonB